MIKHVVKASDERQANQEHTANSRALADYYRSTGQQLSEPELNWLDSFEHVERLARQRRDVAQELQHGL